MKQPIELEGIEISFSEYETQLIGALVDENGTSEVQDLLPIKENDLDKDDLESAWTQLDFCLRVNRRAEDIIRKIRPIIGRMLVWAKENPEFYQRKGFAKYEHFISRYVCGITGLKRSTLYASRFVAERLKGVSAEILVELGPSKSATLAGMAKSTDSTFPELLARAINSTEADLRKFADVKTIGGGTAGMETDVIMIRCDKETFEFWEDTKECPEVHAVVGSDKAYKILNAMMAECAYWRNKAPVVQDTEGFELEEEPSYESN